MTVECEFTVRDNHPSLPGHFPGNPVVPGAVVLNEAVAGLKRLSGLHVLEIRRAKFHLPLPINTTCRMRTQRRADGDYALTCVADGNDILSAVLRCEETAAA